ncbi:unnamed protein product [Bemisia tabaci]|uniref:DNA 3'-5' helicase n=1 Tax=Bemisia tabaci TaxID=7038 RepID=A0A9P0ALH8_BEMTA|nr:unnamed protein product [Bemisia tabaci]
MVSASDFEHDDATTPVRFDTGTTDSFEDLGGDRFPPNNRSVFILVTPETLSRSPALRGFAQAAGFPVAFIFDEAHTVPSWGIEFRGELLQVAETIRYIPRSRLILSSASISLPDIKFIERCYGKKIETVFTQLFIRPNVKYTVLSVQNLPGGKKSILKFLSSYDDIATFLNGHFPRGSVIVFIENKKLVNKLAAGLNGAGFPVVRYHSDMTPNAKIVAMHSWIAGNPRFIIATSAISLGVDSERCIRTVHFGQASSIYNLIQETGRVAAYSIMRNSKMLTILHPAHLERLSGDVKSEAGEKRVWNQQ